MLFKLKKYISIFTLAVFMYPLVVEEVHIYQHRNDFHCTERNSIHFHQMEHHCPICDYVPVASDKPVYFSGISRNVVLTTASFIFYEGVIVEKHNYFFSLRGPPAVS